MSQFAFLQAEFADVRSHAQGEVARPVRPARRLLLIQACVGSGCQEDVCAWSHTTATLRLHPLGPCPRADFPQDCQRRSCGEGKADGTYIPNLTRGLSVGYNAISACKETVAVFFSDRQQVEMAYSDPLGGRFTIV